MRQTAIVIDNFFDNPDEIRDLALKTLEFDGNNLVNDDKRHYPGIRSNHLGVIQPELHVKLKHEIENIVGRKLPTFSSYFHATTQIHGCGLCHADPNEVAGLIYLNHKAPEDTGTYIVDAWNGDEFRFTSEEENAFWDACETTDFDEIEKFKNLKEEVNAAYFKQSINIENRYNRLIVYSGQKHHAPAKYFGHNLNTARLTLVFFGFYDYWGW